MLTLITGITVLAVMSRDRSHGHIQLTKFTNFDLQSQGSTHVVFMERNPTQAGDFTAREVLGLRREWLL